MATVAHAGPNATAATPTPGTIAFVLPPSAILKTWGTRDTSGFSGTTASMMAVAHGVAREYRGSRVFLVHPKWVASVTEESVTYCSPAELPAVHTIVFPNDKTLPVAMLQAIVADKAVQRLIIWRHNVWGDYKHVPDVKVPVGPQLVFNSWFEYYSFGNVHDWPNSQGYTAIVIPNPVIVRPRNTSSCVDQNKLVYASAPRKGLKATYAAFAAIHRAIPSMRLKVFCPTYSARDHPDDFEKFPLPESARGNVDIVGDVGRARLADEMETALAVLYPARYHETFGNSLVEANALGTPVIHMPMGALPETLWNPGAQSVTVATFAEDSAKLVQRYRTGHRPEVQLHDRFRIDAVAQEWVRFLALDYS